MPEFHVWDFSERIEVRLNDSYIDKIRNLTVKKKIHVKDKCPRMGHGWKKPHRREFVVEKDVKLIAFSAGHPYHKIAERLYAKKDWHGPDRPMVEHRPFITIKEFQKVHKVTGLPLEEMEQNVIEIRNHWSGHVEFPMSFPVTANEDWAWLFGLWFSCGGLITRTRYGSGPRHEGFRFEERSVRFRVDTRVYEEKVKPLLSRIAYTPPLTEVYYVKKGQLHKMDRNRRAGVGNQPRKIFTLVRPFREIMEKFGLPTIQPKQAGKGGKIPNRRFGLILPDWIKNDSKNLHAFIEGYSNGSQLGSSFYTHDKKGHIVRNVELRFAGAEEKETYAFLEPFREHLAKLGISTYFHRIPKPTSSFTWLGLWIINQASLNRFYEEFDIRRPDLRARLTLGYFMNALLYEACRELTSSEILVLGALIEKPMSTQEILKALRFRIELVQGATRKLQKLDLTQEVDGKWVINPTGYRDQLIKKLWTLELKRRETIMQSNVHFFSRCSQCSNVIPSNYVGPCGCGGQYQPISRVEALKRMGGLRRGYTTLIQRIKHQKIPSSFSVGCSNG